ncbi:MAG: hypothetical protein ACOYZ6_07890 [Chloroflexota bacterium]
MRNIGVLDLHGVTVEEVIEEFNDRQMELGIVHETEIISINVRPETNPRRIAQPDGAIKESSVVVTIFYWKNI